MTELAGKIEAAGGPSRKIDAEIRKYLRLRGDVAGRGYKPYTASLDAAISLVPEGDDVCWTMGNAPWTQFCARIWSCDPAREEPFDVAASAATPALALVAAALRAGGTDE